MSILLKFYDYLVLKLIGCNLTAIVQVALLLQRGRAMLCVRQ